MQYLLLFGWCSVLLRLENNYPQMDDNKQADSPHQFEQIWGRRTKLEFKELRESFSTGKASDAISSSAETNQLKVKEIELQNKENELTRACARIAELEAVLSSYHVSSVDVSTFSLLRHAANHRPVAINDNTKDKTRDVLPVASVLLHQQQHLLQSTNNDPLPTSPKQLFQGNLPDRFRARLEQMQPSVSAETSVQADTAQPEVGRDSVSDSDHGEDQWESDAAVPCPRAGSASTATSDDSLISAEIANAPVPIEDPGVPGL